MIRFLFCIYVYDFSLVEQPWIVCPAIYDTINIDRGINYLIDADIITTYDLPVFVLGQYRVWMERSHVGVFLQQINRIQKLIRNPLGRLWAYLHQMEVGNAVNVPPCRS